MLNDIMELNHKQWLPIRSDIIPTHDLIAEIVLLLNYEKYR